MGKKAILLGATGLIGSKLLTLLIQHEKYESFTVFVRSKMALDHPKLNQIITDFKNLDHLKNEISGDVIFSCLGSTKNKTPDLAVYKKIDHDYPLYFAHEGLKNGIKSFHIVSSLGADSKSSNFYTKMKGEIEDDLKEIGFDSTFIYQPSFLKGNRSENRPIEKILNPIMSVLDLLLFGPLKKYRSIEALDVAKAMLNESITNKRGIFVIESDKIKELT
ncbi:MAG: NAD(P)H-binding protein [Pelobium sp.]